MHRREQDTLNGMNKDGRLHLAFEVYFTMYDQSLDTNRLIDETCTTPPALELLKEFDVHAHRPLSLTNSDSLWTRGRSQREEGYSAGPWNVLINDFITPNMS